MERVFRPRSMVWGSTLVRCGPFRRRNSLSPLIRWPLRFSNVFRGEGQMGSWALDRQRWLSSTRAFEDGENRGAALTCRITTAESAAAILQVLGPHVDDPDFNSIHIGASWNCLAQYRVTLDNSCQRSRVLEQLTRKTALAIKSAELGPRESANLFWAVAKLHDTWAEPAASLLPALVNLLPLHSSVMNAQDVSNVMWGAAVLPLSDEQLAKLLPGLCTRARDRVETLGAQEVANMMWAAAKLARRSPEDMNGQAVRSAGSLKTRVPCLQDLLPVLTTQFARVLSSPAPQEVSNILWAAATLKQQCPNLLEDSLPILLSATKVSCTRMNPQSIANSVWALIKLKITSQDRTEVLHALVTAATPRVQQMKGQEMANACQSFARAGVKDMAFLTEVSKQVVQKSSRWSRKSKEFDLPEILLGFALLGVRDQALMRAVANEMEGLLPKAMPVSLCALALSFEELDNENAFSDFRARVTQQLKMKEVSPEAVSRVRLGIAEWTEWYKAQSG